MEASRTEPIVGRSSLKKKGLTSASFGLGLVLDLGGAEVKEESFGPCGTPGDGAVGPILGTIQPEC